MFGDNVVLVTQPGVTTFLVKATNRGDTLQDHPAIDVSDLRLSG